VFRRLALTGPPPKHSSGSVPTLRVGSPSLDPRPRFWAAYPNRATAQTLGLGSVPTLRVGTIYLG